MSQLKPGSPLPWTSPDLYSPNLRDAKGESIGWMNSYDDVDYLVHVINAFPRLEAENAALRDALEKLKAVCIDVLMPGCRGEKKELWIVESLQVDDAVNATDKALALNAGNPSKKGN